VLRLGALHSRHPVDNEIHQAARGDRSDNRLSQRQAPSPIAGPGSGV
jgi:hypothetical protein